LTTLSKSTVSSIRERSSNTHAYVAIVIGLAAASFAAVLMRLSLDAGVPSVFVATARVALATILLTPFVLRFYGEELRRLTRRDVLLSALAGSLLGVHFMLIATAFDHTTILVGQIIINTGPLWVAMMEVVLLKTKLSRIVWLGIFLAMMGGLIIGVGSASNGAVTDETVDTAVTAEVTTNSQEEALTTETPSENDRRPLLGSVMALFGAIAGAAYLTTGRQARARISLLPYVWMAYGFGAITGGIVMVFMGVSPLGYSGEAYMWLILLTLGPQLIGHSSLNYAVGYLSATIVSVTTQSIAISAAIIAFFLFAEVPTLIEVFGSVVIAVGVLMSILDRSKKTTVTSS